jgi:CheY-like chemotaxis protein
VCSLLADHSDWDVYEAESGKVALHRIQEVEPDVVVLAVLMTEMNGLEAASKIRKLSPENESHLHEQSLHSTRGRGYHPSLRR